LWKDSKSYGAYLPPPLEVQEEEEEDEDDLVPLSLDDQVAKLFGEFGWTVYHWKPETHISDFRLHYWNIFLSETFVPVHIF
jgi:hypothetical protein